MNNVLDRLGEPSTYAGAAALVYGSGDLVRLFGEGLSSGGWTGGLIAAFGGLAMIMRERGRR